MSRVIVTGANGFVGRALCRALLAAGTRLRGSCAAGVFAPKACRSGCTRLMISMVSPTVGLRVCRWMPSCISPPAFI